MTTALLTTKFEVPTQLAIEPLVEPWKAIVRRDAFPLGRIAAPRSGRKSRTYTQHENHGLYVITSPEDGRVIFVGRSRRKRSISFELSLHLLGSSPIAKCFPTRSVRGKLLVRVLRINNESYRMRCHLFGVSVYWPECNKAITV